MTANISEHAELPQSIQARKYKEAAVIARAWTDEAYRSKLFADPKAALAEMGVEVPSGISIQVVEERPETLQIVLPARPETGAELTDDDLARVAGGIDIGWGDGITTGL